MIYIKSPKFWYEKKGLLAYILFPLSILYYLIFNLKRLFAISITAPMKIICIGNANVGGSGKTPIAILVANLVLEKKIKVGFLTRGYGGEFKGAIKVNADFHDAKLVGDEALLLAKIAPVYVSRNRIDGIKLAKDDHIEMIIMDDGMQNYQLKKDIVILVVDGNRIFGNEFLVPAGPLRQTINSAIRDASCIVINDSHRELNLKTDKIIIHTTTEAITNNIEDKNYVAFAGIGNNEKFFQTLKKLNLNVLGYKSFPDHYYYTEKDLDELLNMGENLITTEKDFCKIPAKYHHRINYLPIKINSTQIDQLKTIIDKIL